MVEKIDFENLIDKNEYQVFICTCPAYFPFSFFKHPWFVLNKKGEISRWEVRDNLNKITKKYIFKNYQKPFEGIPMSFFVKKCWGSKIFYKIDSSIAEEIIKYIENSEFNYPYADKYVFYGPNSNTYIQWVLKQFPELDIKLPWRFIGKNYKLR
jgi:hypothetical protein